MHMSHVLSQVTWILWSFYTLGWQCLGCVDAVTSNPLTSVTSEHAMHTRWWYGVFLITTTVSEIIISITLPLLRSRDNQAIFDRSTVCHFVPYHEASAKAPSGRQVLKLSSLVDWFVHTMEQLTVYWGLKQSPRHVYFKDVTLPRSRQRLSAYWMLGFSDEFMS